VRIALPQVFQVASSPGLMGQRGPGEPRELDVTQGPAKKKQENSLWGAHPPRSRILILVRIVWLRVGKECLLRGALDSTQKGGPRDRGRALTQEHDKFAPRGKGQAPPKVCPIRPEVKGGVIPKSGMKKRERLRRAIRASQLFRPERKMWDRPAGGIRWKGESFALRQCNVLSSRKTTSV